MKYLYCYKKSQCLSDSAKKYDNGDIKVFTPKIWRLSLHKEPRSLKTLAVRLLFQFTTRGKAKIYYMTNSDELMHTSYVVPQCNKFPFLGKNDYEIGPCFTYPKHRGKGIYPYVLRHICNSFGNSDTTFYMIVDDANIASIKGIEKAGFIKYGVVEVSKYTKRYKLVKTY